MKVRIDQASIRFRLNEREWVTLLTNEQLSQSTHLPGNEKAALTYTLEHDPLVSVTAVTLLGTVLIVKLAPDDWLQITRMNRESIRCALPPDTSEREPLVLIVEKDIIISRKRTERHTTGIINESEKQAI